ncbi:hypothetical protein Avbf_05368 [Armadillidium vulgare]|nr:hypothetical protein Avbf_05368 [Armadillidium vulgare]
MPSREYYMKGLSRVSDSSCSLLGADPERAKQELEDVVKFEMEIANYTLPEELRRNIELLYNKITLGELAIQVPEFHGSI